MHACPTPRFPHALCQQTAAYRPLSSPHPPPPPVFLAVRGNQATDAGYQGTASRNGVVALSWLEAILFFFAFLAVVYDR